MTNPNYIPEYFSKLKILDLSTVLAGPQVGSFFSELGSKVIKVENKRSNGDPTRQWKLEVEKGRNTISSYYASANYQKESIFLDLQDVDDYMILLSLAKEADILLSNYQLSVAHKLKVDYASLKAINPNIIYAQLYAYDADDTRPGYDLVMQAETGFMSMNGHPDGAIAKMPVAIIDIMAAHQLKEALLIALIKREKEAAGSLVEVSLYQSAIASLANQAGNYLMADHIPKKLGSLHPNIAPYGDSYTTKDNITFLLAVGSDSQFHKLGKALRSDHLLSSIFVSNSNRLANRLEMNGFLQHEFGQRTFEETDILLAAQNIPFCRVLSLDSVFKNRLAKNMILDDVIGGDVVKSVSQIAFTIK